MLEKMFYPASVAVIGASKEQGKVGRAVLDNLVAGFGGRIYPINPKADEIDGLKCYKSVLDVPGEIDLAVVVIPAKLVPGAVKECGEKGIRYLVIISAGFKEIGPEGARLENEVKTHRESSTASASSGPTAWASSTLSRSATRPSPGTCRRGATSPSSPSRARWAPPSSTGRR